MSDEQKSDGASTSTLKMLVGILATTTVGLLIGVIVLATQKSSSPAPSPVAGEPEVADKEPVVPPVDVEEESASAMEQRNLAAFLQSKSASSFFEDPADNACSGKKLALDNALCVDMEVQPQAGANVTKGYVGGMDVGDIKPNTAEYYASKMCPVNVHWHLGAEHYSVGEYDEDGDGPHGNAEAPDWAQRARDLAEGKDVRAGFRCHHYDADDEKFTKPYDWKYCEGMEVGETYEVHWPHSAAGACGRVNQYQTPFYDGVFCNLDMDTFSTLQKQDIANAVGVHGQVFTIVNDESYFYPDMMRGMIKDVGEHGKDIAYYTGSTTGTTRDNEICSQYTPITWQVDRKCHMISASSFDKMCYEMKMQRDDMSGDLHAHGARELVTTDLVANNQVDRGLRGA